MVEEKNNDLFGNIGTSLTALSLFYAILLQVISFDFNAPVFWKYMLIFGLLLFTFFFSLAIYASTKNKNEMLGTAGLFVIIFWFLMLFFLQNTINEAYKYLFSSLTKFGLGWLIILPSFLIIISSIFLVNRTYRKIISFRKKLIYTLMSVLISGESYLCLKNNLIFPYIGQIIIKINLPWLQVLIAGIFIGIIISLIAIPIIPSIKNILYWLSGFLAKKTEKPIKKNHKL